MAAVINVFTINDGAECSAKTWNSSRRSSETPTIGPMEVSSAS